MHVAVANYAVSISLHSWRTFLASIGRVLYTNKSVLISFFSIFKALWQAMEGNILEAEGVSATIDEDMPSARIYCCSETGWKYSSDWAAVSGMCTLSELLFDLDTGVFRPRPCLLTTLQNYTALWSTVMRKGMMCIASIFISSSLFTLLGATMNFIWLRKH